MKNACLSILVAVALAPGAALAQQPAPPAAPAPVAPAAPAAPRPATAQAAPQPRPASAAPRPVLAPPGQLVNIRIDVTVSEEGGDAAPSRRTVTLTLADRQPGSVRSIGMPEAGTKTGPPRLNVDAFPLLQSNGRIQTQVTLDYGTPGRGTTIKVEPLLESGKPLVVSQAPDPTSERRISVELTATVLK